MQRITPSRRALLAGLAASPFLARAATARTSGFRQPDRADPEGFLSVAHDMLDRAVADGDQPFGAVVVKDGKIVGWGPSRVVTDTDPTAHAETIAVRNAAKRLGTRDLYGCVMYSTSHPCPMCEASAYWANIDRFVYGDGTDGDRPRLRRC